VANSYERERDQCRAEKRYHFGPEWNKKGKHGVKPINGLGGGEAKLPVDPQSWKL